MLHWKRIVIRINSAFLNSCVSHLKALRNVSTVNPEYLPDGSVKIARTSLHPKDHTLDQLGMWYTMKPEMINRLFHFHGLPKMTKELHDIFQEASFMIREPAVNIIDYISRSNLSHPVSKYVLYGRAGAGKTSILSHLTQYFVEEGWMVVHVTAPSRWSAAFKEIVPSVNREGYFDHTQDAALWLQQFRLQNESLLEDPNLVTSETYEWTQREITEKGSPLSALVDFGISRARFASESIFHLTKELKTTAKEGRVKVAVAVDGLNALFAPESKFKTENKTPVSCSQFTLFEAFINLLQKDWNNGVIVGTVDKTMSTVDKRKSDLPRYLLRKKGWECLEPFVPIKVNDFTDREFESAVNYYLDRMWLQHPAGRTREGKEELSFLSGNNGGALIELVNGL